MSIHLIGYSFEADIHCITCTLARHANRPFSNSSKRLDECGLPESAEDSEGNPIHPIFSTDESGQDGGDFCGDCGEKL